MERVHNKLKDSCKRKDLQSAMRKVVVVRRKEEVISRNILWKRSTMQNQKSDFSERKKIEVSQKEAIQRKNFKSLFRMQKTKPLCKELLKKRESNRTS